MDVSQVSQAAIQKNTWVPARTKIIIAIALLVIALSGWGIYRIFRNKPVDRTFEKVPAKLNSVKKHKELVSLKSEWTDSIPAEGVPISKKILNNANHGSTQAATSMNLSCLET